MTEIKRTPSTGKPKRPREKGKASTPHILPEDGNGQVSETKCERRQWITTLAFLFVYLIQPMQRHFRHLPLPRIANDRAILSLGRSFPRKVRPELEKSGIGSDA